MSENLKNSSDSPSENGGSENNPGEVESVKAQPPEEIVVAVQRALQGFFYESQWSGPLPPPADFAAYKEVLESAPERITRLAEEGSSHHVQQGVRHDRLAGRVVTGRLMVQEKASGNNDSNPLSFCDMRTLYLRNVPDEVVDRLETLAGREGLSVSAMAVRELAVSSRRADNLALLGDLPGLGISTEHILDALHESRAER